MINGDVTSSSILKKYLKGQDFVIPLAALVGAPLCDKHPKQIKINVEAIKNYKNNKEKQKIIYLTTNSVTGLVKKINFVMKIQN